MVELANSNWTDFLYHFVNNEFLKEYYPTQTSFIEQNRTKFESDDEGISAFPFPILILENKDTIVKANEKSLEFFEKKFFGDIIGKKLDELGIKQDFSNISPIENQLLLFKTTFEFLPFPKNLELNTLLFNYTFQQNNYLIWVIPYDKALTREYHQILKTFEELKLILNNIPYIVYLKDKQNRIIKVNQVFCNKFHLTPEAVEGKFADSIFSTEAVRVCREKEKELLSTGKPITGSEERFTINSKIENYFIVERIPLFDGNEIFGILVFAYDITEKKKTEIELRRWKKRFDFVTEATGQAVFERDWETGQVVWTDNIKNLFGFSPKELKTRDKWLEKIIPEDIEAYKKSFQMHCDNLSPTIDIQNS